MCKSPGWEVEEVPSSRADAAWPWPSGCTPPGMPVQLVGCKGHGAQGSALISKEPTRSPFQQMLGMVDTDLALWGFGD